MAPLQRKLVRDLWSRKGSLATLLVIMAIGVGAYVGMASVWRDLDGAGGGRSAAADDPSLWNPLRPPGAHGMCDMTAGKRRKEGT